MILRHCKWDEGCIIQSHVVIYCGLSWIWRGLFIYLWSTCFSGATNDHNFPKRFSPPPHSWAILRTLVSLAHSTAFLWKTGLVWPPKPACFLSSAGTSWQKTCGIVDMVWLYPNQWPSDRCQQFKRSSQLQPHMILSLLPVGNTPNKALSGSIADKYPYQSRPWPKRRIAAFPGRSGKPCQSCTERPVAVQDNHTWNVGIWGCDAMRIYMNLHVKIC